MLLLTALYEPEARYAAQPGTLARGPSGVRQSLAAVIDMKGTLDLKVTRILEASDLALVIGEWSFKGTGRDGEPVKLSGHTTRMCCVGKRTAPGGSAAAGFPAVVVTPEKPEIGQIRED
ncbi:MAG TPA: nuclear transport factor 2 family protein [Vicinamibacterales bacterium]|nr:nuclear transport factor 2 family protein [Vicinamibacterales bacterium]